MKQRLIFACILIFYCAILIKVMVFKNMPTISIGGLMLNFSGTDAGHAPNFIPFRTILPYLIGHKGFLIASINLIGNIILLVPVGFLVPFVFRNMNWKKCLVLAVASGLTIEVMQVVLQVGIFDIDDVILNALGVIIGYWAFAMLTRWLRARNYKKIAVAVIILIAAGGGFLYAIYPKGQQPIIRPQAISGVVQADSINHKESESNEGGDLCRGTGGTGRIIHLGDHAITIIRNDSSTQVITLTGFTKIRASAGPASTSDLITGQRVTLVIDESETASLVLICNVARGKNAGGK